MIVTFCTFWVTYSFFCLLRCVCANKKKTTYLSTLKSMIFPYNRLPAVNGFVYSLKTVLMRSICINLMSFNISHVRHHHTKTNVIHTILQSLQRLHDGGTPESPHILSIYNTFYIVVCDTIFSNYIHFHIIMLHK